VLLVTSKNNIGLLWHPRTDKLVFCDRSKKDNWLVEQYKWVKLLFWDTSRLVSWLLWQLKEVKLEFWDISIDERLLLKQYNSIKAVKSSIPDKSEIFNAPMFKIVIELIFAVGTSPLGIPVS
jgi:hypothetical protein